MINQVIIVGDQIRFIGFSCFADNDTINICIYGYKKVVISNFIPRFNTQLSCHNILMLRDSEHVDQDLVDKLIEAGVASRTKFIRIRNTYIADIHG